MNKDSITNMLRKKQKELNLNYNSVLSQFFFDEFLKLISLSRYRENFMLKGGLLLTYTLGIQNRTTQDIDFLVKGIHLNSKSIKNTLESILINSDTSKTWFEIISEPEEIRIEDNYGGLRFHVVGHLSNIRIPFAIDIATGDPIYPFPKITKYTTILGNSIELRLYPLESVISEKLQTVLAKAENNSRSKDFYDIYTILKNKSEEIDFDALKTSVSLTFKYRNTKLTKENALNIIHYIYSNTAFNDRWIRYQKKNPYAQDIDFNSIIYSIENLIKNIM